jgi:hypothetical protein
MRTSQPQILLITDSLAFPRATPEVVCYQDTYVSLLKAEFPNYDFIHVGRGGGTIVELYKHTTYFHTTITPTLVLMQCGIVDCAPRALSITEQQIISRLPVASSFVASVVKRNAKRLRRYRKLTYTPSSVFVKYIEHFESLYDHVHWIGILPATEEYENLISGITENINKYNSFFRCRRFVSTDDFTGEDIMTDFHHLNRRGHQRMFKKLAALIRRELPRQNNSDGEDLVISADRLSTLRVR